MIIIEWIVMLVSSAIDLCILYLRDAGFFYLFSFILLGILMLEIEGWGREIHTFPQI